MNTQIQLKLSKIRNMKASYKFRLSAMLACDNRKGTFHVMPAPKPKEATGTYRERLAAIVEGNKATIQVWGV